MMHDSFEVAEWYRERFLHIEVRNGPYGSPIFGPYSAVEIERVRRIYWEEFVASEASVPAHVFVWGIGEQSNRVLTKVGGLPYFPRDAEWPKDDAGVCVPFFAQICFLDSQMLFDFELPGDVLLIFASDHRNSDCWKAVWQKAGIPDEDLVGWQEVQSPRGQIPLFAHLWKTEAILGWHDRVKMTIAEREIPAEGYLKANDGGLRGESGFLFQFWATQICEAPFCRHSNYEIVERNDFRTLGSICGIRVSSDERVFPMLNSPDGVASSHYKGIPSKGGRIPRTLALFEVGGMDLDGRTILFSPERNEVRFGLV